MLRSSVRLPDFSLFVSCVSLVNFVCLLCLCAWFRALCLCAGFVLCVCVPGVRLVTQLVFISSCVCVSSVVFDIRVASVLLWICVFVCLVSGVHVSP